MHGKILMTFAASVLFATAACAADRVGRCDANTGSVDLDACPVERAQIEREQRALALADHLCRNTAECRDAGAAAFKTGDWRLAIHYFEQQASHAEQSRDLLDTTVAYHNAALAHLRARNCLGARDWLDAATALDPADDRARLNEHLYAKECGDV